MLRRYTQRLYILINPQVRSRDRPLILRHRFGRSLEDDVAAHRAAAGTELDEPVAGFQHLDVVLDEEDGVSGIYHRIKEAQDALDVAGVETVGVTWGFRSREELEAFQPLAVVDTTEELEQLILTT